MTNEETIKISLDMPKDLADKLDIIANDNRRSRAAEIVFRLEKSFEKEKR